MSCIVYLSAFKIASQVVVNWFRIHVHTTLEIIKMTQIEMYPWASVPAFPNQYVNNRGVDCENSS